MPTRDLTVPTPDGPMRLYEAMPDGDARAAVVVVQEAFGVNDHIEDVTRRFAAAGYHAVAPALFHRAGGGTAPYGEFDKVLPLFAGIEGDDDVLEDIDAAVDHLRAAGWADGQIGIVGFCLGGRITFLTCLRRPTLGAGVGFYGGGIVASRFPQFPPLVGDAGTLTVPWLGLFGDEDGSIPVDDVEALRAALTDAPAATEIVRYPDAGHGFHCDARPEYVESAARDAWSRTLAWFDDHLA